MSLHIEGDEMFLEPDERIGYSAFEFLNADGANEHSSPRRDTPEDQGMPQVTFSVLPGGQFRANAGADPRLHVTLSGHGYTQRTLAVSGATPAKALARARSKYRGYNYPGFSITVDTSREPTIVFKQARDNAWWCRLHAATTVKT